MRCLREPAFAKLYHVSMLQDAIASAALDVALLMCDYTTNMCSSAKASLRNQMTRKCTPNQFA